jgi:hypothetical protein
VGHRAARVPAGRRPTSDGGAAARSLIDPIIRLDRVSKAYSEGGEIHHVLREASVSFTEGEIVAQKKKWTRDNDADQTGGPPS